MRRALPTAAAITAAVLGWGYWHAKTHASVTIRVTPDVPVEIIFYDSANHPLARAHTSQPYNVIAPIHPQARDNGPASFAAQAKWIPQWAPRVHHATVTSPTGIHENIPVEVHEYTESWWLWWVPLPHVGGVPYGYFDLSLSVSH